MERHVAIIGGGIAGLAAAPRAARRARRRRDATRARAGRRARRQATHRRASPAGGSRPARRRSSRGRPTIRAARERGRDARASGRAGRRADRIRRPRRPRYSRPASCGRCPAARSWAYPRMFRVARRSRAPRGSRTATTTPVGPVLTAGADVAVGALVRQRFGDAVVDHLVDPLLGGVYAGRADDLSLAVTMPAWPTPAASSTRCRPRCGPRCRGVRAPSAPAFATVAGGLSRLVAAIGIAMPAARRQARPAGTRDRPIGDRWRLVLGSTRDPRPLDVDAVVLACRPHPAARLLAGVRRRRGRQRRCSGLRQHRAGHHGCCPPAPLTARPGWRRLPGPGRGRARDQSRHGLHAPSGAGSAGRRRAARARSLGRYGDEPCCRLRRRCCSDLAHARAWARSLGAPLPAPLASHRDAVGRRATAVRARATSTGSPTARAALPPTDRAGRRGVRRRWHSRLHPVRSTGRRSSHRSVVLMTEPNEMPTPNGHVEPQVEPHAAQPRAVECRPDPRAERHDPLHDVVGVPGRRRRCRPCATTSPPRSSRCSTSWPAKDVVDPRHLRRRRAAGRRRRDDLVARPTQRCPAGRVQPVAAHGARPPPPPVWSQMALHRPAEFNKSHLPAFLAGEDARAYVCVYPFVRSYEWYLLPDEERRDMLAEHGMRRAATRTCGRTRSRASRSVTTSGCSRSRPTSCTGSWT